ncbi:flagellar biosynthesis anti-sigma factor FlgM [Chitinasiproducens palmae]|uniref:Negative regulator of flagellin synthesis n=1 Tax=Chitinasiproducens palmae TaxID=1770053 RepID=A0A1H2PK06_9BURK|nr:flagellar biosynthesis anti-sigma factor FlgM [Chitinasiproducens palmae]SDV46612.1 anti-sigma-28 factor, FlgM family [Chitinasiproducens palmae]
MDVSKTLSKAPLSNRSSVADVKTGQASNVASGSAASAATTAGTVSAPTTAGGDAVQLSTTSASLRASAVDSSRDIDTERVAQIRAAIADGTLSVNPAKIADGLIDTVRDLLGNSSRA